jgi:hypothetical protein
VSVCQRVWFAVVCFYAFTRLAVIIYQHMRKHTRASTGAAAKHGLCAHRCLLPHSAHHTHISLVCVLQPPDDAAWAHSPP